MTGRYLVMDNATIHKRPDMRKLIVDQGYKVTYHPPYSPFLNPIELFWTNFTVGIKREMF
jgi:transposase